MTREEIKDFCDMKAQLEPENEDIYKAIVKALEQEPKKGHWIDIKNKNGTVIAARCSRCGNSPKHAIKSDFCPNCGATMQEVDE